MISSGKTPASTNSTDQVKVISADANKTIDTVHVVNEGSKGGFCVINGIYYRVAAYAGTPIYLPKQNVPDIFIERDGSSDMAGVYIFATYRGQ